MALISTADFNVANQAPVEVQITATVQPPLGFGTGGRGRLEHPTFGAYDYVHRPTETINIDGDVCYGPRWAHEETLGGGADVLWNGYIRDAVVTERWKEGDVGTLLSHLRMLWTMYANPPDPGADQFVIWKPNYATARAYKVAIVDLTSGGEGYKLDWMLLRSGLYTPSPVELKLRVFGYAD